MNTQPLTFTHTVLVAYRTKSYPGPKWQIVISYQPLKLTRIGPGILRVSKSYPARRWGARARYARACSRMRRAPPAQLGALQARSRWVGMISNGPQNPRKRRQRLRGPGAIFGRRLIMLTRKTGRIKRFSIFNPVPSGEDLVEVRYRMCSLCEGLWCFAPKEECAAHAPRALRPLPTGPLRHRLARAGRRRALTLARFWRSAVALARVAACAGDRAAGAARRAAAVAHDAGRLAAVLQQRADLAGGAAAQPLAAARLRCAPALQAAVAASRTAAKRAHALARAASEWALVAPSPRAAAHDLRPLLAPAAAQLARGWTSRRLCWRPCPSRPSCPRCWRRTACPRRMRRCAPGACCMGRRGPHRWRARTLRRLGRAAHQTEASPAPPRPVLTTPPSRRSLPRPPPTCACATWRRPTQQPGSAPRGRAWLAPRSTPPAPSARRASHAACARRARARAGAAASPRQAATQRPRWQRAGGAGRVRGAARRGAPQRRSRRPRALGAGRRPRAGPRRRRRRAGRRRRRTRRQRQRRARACRRHKETAKRQRRRLGAIKHAAKKMAFSLAPLPYPPRLHTPGLIYSACACR